MTSERDAYDALCSYTLSLGDADFIHQHVVDAFTAPHADEASKPIALAFALVELYLLVEKTWSGRQVQRVHMRLGRRKRAWPVFALPHDRGSMIAVKVMDAPKGRKGGSVEAHAKVTLGVVLACLLPGWAYAQAPSPSSSGALEAMVKEIRLLRQTLERQAVIGARSQLIIARLTLYDQRAARARAAADRLEGEVANAEREREQLQAAAREMARSLEQVTDPDRRQQLELESRMLRTRMVQAETQRSRSEARLAQAKQTLDLEAGRFDELERWLNDLDRQLQVGQ